MRAEALLRGRRSQAPSAGAGGTYPRNSHRARSRRDHRRTEPPQLSASCVERSIEGLLGCHRARELADHLPFRGRQGLGCRFCRLPLKEATTMQMKNPCHPGSLIKADIDELGLSLVEAAK